MFEAFNSTAMASGENSVLEQRPYIATAGKYAGTPVIAVNTGRRDEKGDPVYAERPANVKANATLTKDAWEDYDTRLYTQVEKRLVIVADLMASGLTHNVGGLGTMASIWESPSQVIDAEMSMDGETKVTKDAIQFARSGVPIPIIHHDWDIGQRQLLASRNSGQSLDVIYADQAAKAIARKSEHMVFFGGTVGAVQADGTNYGTIPGLTTFADRETFTISDWSDTSTPITPETIFSEILQMVQKMETGQRAFGPFNIYIPGAYASRFREDFKANSDKTLMERVLDEDVISSVKVSDVLTDGNVSMVQMESEFIDLAIASDVTTVAWESGSGFLNHFKSYAAWAPRLKSSFDGFTGIMHASV